MAMILNEIRSFAEDQGTLERSLGFLGGVSINAALVGTGLYAFGRATQTDTGFPLDDISQATGAILAVAGAIGAAGSLIGYGISKFTSMLRNRAYQRGDKL